MWRLFSKSEPQLLTRRVLRLKFEYCVVLRVRAPSWKDAVLSRFISEDRRMAEGKEKAEAVLQALRDAGLVLRVKKHLTKDGAKLLLVFVTADLRRLEQQSQRLFIERWLQEEGIGDTMGEHGSGSSIAARRAATKPAMRIVRVGGLHYFASDPKQQQQQQQPPAAEAEPPSTFKVSAAGRIELLDHILRSPAAQGGAGLEALQKESKRGGVIQAVFPLHDGHWNAELLRRARRVNPFIPSSRDAFLREVRGQFGEKVAFYFAFNCFYTSWLLVRRAIRRTSAQFDAIIPSPNPIAPGARHPRRAALDDLLLRRVAAAAARAAVRTATRLGHRARASHTRGSTQLTCGAASRCTGTPPSSRSGRRR